MISLTRLDLAKCSADWHFTTKMRYALQRFFIVGILGWMPRNLGFSRQYGGWILPTMLKCGSCFWISKANP
jgi:hypothetical protein